MTDYFNTNLDDEPILQGDVFRVGESCNGLFSSDEKYAVVITADCDIVNNKMGGNYTFLPIVSAKSYVEKYWMVDVFKKENQIVIKECCDKINNEKLPEKFECLDITPIQMMEWLKYKELTDIFETSGIDINHPKIRSLIDRSNILKLETNIENYSKLRAYQKRTEKSIKSEIRASLEKPRQDYYYIPEVERKDSIGKIIKLRDIRAVSKEFVFAKEFDLRISTADPTESLVRVGRFSDYLRYSITQRFASVFTKIGMPPSFESEVHESLTLITEHILESFNEH